MRDVPGVPLFRISSTIGGGSPFSLLLPDSLVPIITGSLREGKEMAHLIARAVNEPDQNFVAGRRGSLFGKPYRNARMARSDSGCIRLEDEFAVAVEFAITMHRMLAEEPKEKRPQGPLHEYRKGESS
jgi:hypothetical protein